MKRSRANLTGKRKDEQDAALAAVLADLESEHGTPQPVLARPRVAASAAVTAPSAGTRDDARGGSRRETAFDAPPGFQPDDVSVFYFNVETKQYFERTPSKTLVQFLNLRLAQTRASCVPL